MPILTGSLTLNGSAQQLQTAVQEVVGLYFTTPAAAVTIGKSDVSAAGKGITPATTTTFGIGAPQGTFSLSEIYVIGTNAQVLTWLAITR
jgi:hypothetical protein